MKKMKDDMVFIDDMLGAIEKIASYTDGVAEEDFYKNGMMVDAVVRNLEIIGEAASNISEPFRPAHPEIEWRRIIGMRNRIIHAYDSVDYEIVWDVVRHDLPSLQSSLKELLP